MFKVKRIQVGESVGLICNESIIHAAVVIFGEYEVHWEYLDSNILILKSFAQSWRN